VAELEIYRARTSKVNILVTQSGVAYNLSGCTLWLTAKFEYGDADSEAVFQLSSPSNGIEITSAADGEAQATIPYSGFTEVLYQKKVLYFDIQLKTAAGEYYTIAEGTFTVKPNVTRTTT
jgi:hypothetical protein